MNRHGPLILIELMFGKAAQLHFLFECNVAVVASARTTRLELEEEAAITERLPDSFVLHQSRLLSLSADLACGLLC